MDQDRGYTPQDMLGYVQEFHISMRDEIIDTILADDVLKKFFNTPEGRLILGANINEIKDHAARVIEMLISGSYKDDVIREAAVKMHGSYLVIHRIASIALKADEHITGIKEMKKRKK